MEPLLKPLIESGILGAVLALMIYDVFYLQRKLLSIIENNTRAMAELKSVIEKCQLSHSGG